MGGFLAGCSLIGGGSGRHKPIRRALAPKKIQNPCRFPSPPFVEQGEGSRRRLETTQNRRSTMRFLSLVRVKETGQRPSEKLMKDMGELMCEMQAKGAIVDTAGLYPTSAGFRMRNDHGKFSRTDGPFTETKEIVGGYAILNADSADEITAMTKRFLDVHGDEWDVECEVRQIAEMDEGC
jgi:hypothetical protein